MKYLSFLTAFLCGYSLCSPSYAESDAYKYCMLDASKVNDDAMAECIKAENARLNQQIYKEFETLANSPEFNKWNNGSGMFRGRFKDMYENWAKYRDEYCDVYKLSMTNYYGSDAYNYQKCLMSINEFQLLSISSLLTNYNSTAD